MVDWRTLVLSVSRVCVAWKLVLKNTSSALVNVPCLFGQEFLALVHVLGAGLQHLALKIGFNDILTVPMDMLASALGKCSRLESLDITGGYRLAGVLLDALAAPSLVDLTLRDVILKRDALARCPGLKSLKLVACDTQDFALPLGLEKLTLHRVSFIRDVNFQASRTLTDITLSEHVASPLLTICRESPRLQRLTARQYEHDLEGPDLEGLALELKRARPSLKIVTLESVNSGGVTLLSVNKQFD
jgi:hypothetical protein